jgi:hypothetical protein
MFRLCSSPWSTNEAWKSAKSKPYKLGQALLDQIKRPVNGRVSLEMVRGGRLTVGMASWVQHSSARQRRYASRSVDLCEPRHK